MKNKIITILGMFLLIGIGLVSAVYPSETRIIPNNLSITNLNWLIVDNSTPLTVLPEVNITTENISIHFPANMPPNDFTMVFLEEQTNTIVQTVIVHSGGGGGGTRTIYKNNTVYKEIPNYITVYQNQTNDAPIETINSIEYIEAPISWEFITIMIILIVILLYLYIKSLRRNNGTFN